MLSVVLLAAVSAYLLFGASDQRRVLAVLRDLAAAVSSLPRETEATRQKRVHSALARDTVQDVTLSAPELGEIEGREAIEALVDSLEGMQLTLSIDQADVRIQGDRAAATLLTTLLLRLPGEERREIRTIAAELQRRSGTYRITSLSVSARSREQPEARP